MTATVPAPTGFEPLDPAIREQYDRDGFVVIPNALPEEDRAYFEDAVDRIYGEEEAAGELRPDRSIHVMGWMHRDPRFVELLTWPRTFPYIWGTMGWNIYTHHNHIDVNPPKDEPPFWNWHQDGYRQNSDIDMDVRPMFMTKICYALTDLSEPGYGNTKVIPGSHKRNTLAGRPEKEGDPIVEPEGAVEVLLKPGDAFIFDRRLWHSRSMNKSERVRKLMFIGYTYRWIRPLDEAVADQSSDWFTGLTPLQQQLLGYGPDHASFWGIKQSGWIDDEIPLRAELKERGLLDRAIPFLR
jgi:hypothetical protein